MLFSRLVIEIDTTAIDAARAKLADLEDALLRAKGDATAVSIEPLPDQIGEFVIDPLESAIRETVGLLRDELQASQAAIDMVPIGTYARLDAHLDELLRMQIDRLTK